MCTQPYNKDRGNTDSGGGVDCKLCTQMMCSKIMLSWYDIFESPGRMLDVMTLGTSGDRKAALLDLEAG